MCLHFFCAVFNKSLFLISWYNSWLNRICYLFLIENQLLMKILNLVVLSFLLSVYSGACNATQNRIFGQGLVIRQQVEKPDSSIVTGAEQTEAYLVLLKGKKTGIVTNQTGICKSRHIVDTLIDLGVNVVTVFCPEHGFRGTADAGAAVDDSIDKSTGLKIISLYGKNKKPKPEQLMGIEIMVFDIQDVGARFYTYISTLHYVMEACAENEIPLIVFDRPNPNGHYVDGPVLDTAFHSFIGMHPVPIVHGMTIGEYAQMINGEHWLPDSLQCKLTVIPCLNYTHSTPYRLPVPPSPNLPDYRSVELYPSLCLFEGTCLSVGRGTDMQFQVIGHPVYKDWELAEFVFTPTPRSGAMKPVLEGQLCFGFDFSESLSPFPEKSDRLNITVLIEAWKHFPDKENFFNNSFNLLAGGRSLRQQIEKGLNEDQIRETWQFELNKFRKIRSKYLIYKE